MAVYKMLELGVASLTNNGYMYLSGINRLLSKHLYGSRTSRYINVYVVVNFLPQVIFVFPLFLGMVMYANKIETKEK